ncbi:MAG: alkaline phosphatase [Myxacorys chilensis ATA2-1-KO14]|jgi:alkaline phosphatase|nr:alkaline phosphatase [Myxacorys chilensis ATA2-1-KO14]
MAKNVILMIGDGMGWEMARAASIYNQIQAGNTGSTLDDFYTSGFGSGLSFQGLKGSSLATTYGTTIADSKGVYSTGNSALDNSESATGSSNVRPGFEFNPTFNPGSTATGGAKVSDGVVGNLVGYDPERGGVNPWTPGYDKEYIKWSYPDSANTATTLYTGVKTYNNAVGVDIYEQPLETILTTAKLGGKSTGLVTSVPIDHATPGAAAASVNRRAKYDGEFPDLDNILQQELRVYQPDVLLGGGHPLSNTKDPLPDGVEPPQTYEFISNDTYDYLRSNPTDNRYGYTFLERGENAAQTLADTAAQLDPNKGDRLIGLYGARGQNGNLPVSSANGDYSTTGLDMFSINSSQGQKQDTTRPLAPGETDASFISREINENPTLKDLSLAALNVLGKDQDGFWLMIEGGDIDWAAHDNSIDNLVGTMNDFDKSVTSVIDWIGQNGGWDENLLIVTADHDHYLTLNPNYPQLVQTLGLEKLTDIDDPAQAGNFWGSNVDAKYGWGNHSNRPVPVYYQGAGSEVLDGFIGQGYESYGYTIPGFPDHIDQSQIYQTMLSAVTGATNLPQQEGNQTRFGDDRDDVIYTSAGDDTVYAEGGNNYVYANRGNNTVYSGSGNDLLYAGDGDDALYGGEGDDTLFAGAGNNRLFGDGGNNNIYAGSGDDFIVASGNNFIRAGSGKNQIYLGDGDDNIATGAGDDLIYANGGENTIDAGAGNNQVYGGGGNDKITTGAGDDVIYASDGDDTIDSGLGNDTIYAGAGVKTITLNAGAGAASIYGFGSDDSFKLGSDLKSGDAFTLKIEGDDTQVFKGEDLLATLKWTRLEKLAIAMDQTKSS